MKPQATLFFPLHVFRGLAGILARIVVAAFIVILVAPSGYSLWYDNLTVDVKVYTADFTYPRSVSYWKSELYRCLQGSSMQATSAAGHNGKDGSSIDAIQLLRTVENSSVVFDFNETDAEALSQAIQILESKNGSPEDQLRAELLALWLNEASGYTEGYRLPLANGTWLTAAKIIERAEDVLANGEEALYYSMAIVAEEYNTRWERR